MANPKGPGRSMVTQGPQVNNPPPLNRDSHRDPDMKALKSRGSINQGFTLQNYLGPKRFPIFCCSATCNLWCQGL